MSIACSLVSRVPVRLNTFYFAHKVSQTFCNDNDDQNSPLNSNPLAIKPINPLGPWVNQTHQTPWTLGQSSNPMRLVDLPHRPRRSRRRRPWNGFLPWRCRPRSSSLGETSGEKWETLLGFQPTRGEMACSLLESDVIEI